MNRAQFMEQLEKLLSDISEEERREALDYYESYFDEAGEDQESAVIQELGSPGKVAAIIKADLRERDFRYGEYTERDYYDEREREPGEMPVKRNSRSRRGRGTLTLIIILLIFLAPFLTGTIKGALGLIVAIIFLPFLVIIAGGAVVIGLLIGGVVTLFAGIGVCVADPAVGVMSMGIGCILTAAGLLGMVFVVWFASRLLPGVLRGFTDLCHRLLHRERGEGAGV